MKTNVITLPGHWYLHNFKALTAKGFKLTLQGRGEACAYPQYKPRAHQGRRPDRSSSPWAQPWASTNKTTINEGQRPGQSFYRRHQSICRTFGPGALVVWISFPRLHLGLDDKTDLRPWCARDALRCPRIDHAHPSRAPVMRTRAEGLTDRLAHGRSPGYQRTKQRS